MSALKRLLKGRKKSSRKNSLSSAGSSTGQSGFRMDSSIGSMLGYPEIQEQSLVKIHKAAWFGDLSKVKQHGKKGGLNQTDKDRRTPLHLACVKGHIHIVQYICVSLGNVNAGDNEGRTPLMKAIECREADCVEMLLNHGASTNTLDVNHCSPLHLAAMTGDVDVGGMLLDKGAMLNVQDKEKTTPLHVACVLGYVNFVDFLLRENSPIDSADIHGRTPLMSSAGEGQINVVKLLLENKPDASLQDKQGDTAVNHANANNHPIIAKTIERYLATTENKTLTSPKMFGGGLSSGSNLPIYGGPAANVITDDHVLDDSLVGNSGPNSWADSDSEIDTYPKRQAKGFGKVDLTAALNRNTSSSAKAANTQLSPQSVGSPSSVSSQPVVNSNIPRMFMADSVKRIADEQNKKAASTKINNDESPKPVQNRPSVIAPLTFFDDEDKLDSNWDSESETFSDIAVSVDIPLSKRIPLKGHPPADKASLASQISPRPTGTNNFNLPNEQESPDVRRQMPLPFDSQHITKNGDQPPPKDLISTVDEPVESRLTEPSSDFSLASEDEDSIEAQFNPTTKSFNTTPDNQKTTSQTNKKIPIADPSLSSSNQNLSVPGRPTDSRDGGSPSDDSQLARNKRAYADLGISFSDVESTDEETESDWQRELKERNDRLNETAKGVTPPRLSDTGINNKEEMIADSNAKNAKGEIEDGIREEHGSDYLGIVNDARNPTEVKDIATTSNEPIVGGQTDRQESFESFDDFSIEDNLSLLEQQNINLEQNLSQKDKELMKQNELLNKQREKELAKEIEEELRKEYLQQQSEGVDVVSQKDNIGKNINSDMMFNDSLNDNEVEYSRSDDPESAEELLLRQMEAKEKEFNENETKRKSGKKFEDEEMKQVLKGMITSDSPVPKTINMPDLSHYEKELNEEINKKRKAKLKELDIEAESKRKQMEIEHQERERLLIEKEKYAQEELKRLEQLALAEKQRNEEAAERERQEVEENRKRKLSDEENRLNNMANDRIRQQELLENEKKAFLNMQKKREEQEYELKQLEEKRVEQEMLTKELQQKENKLIENIEGKRLEQQQQQQQQQEEQMQRQHLQQNTLSPPPGNCDVLNPDDETDSPVTGSNMVKEDVIVFLEESAKGNIPIATARVSPSPSASRRNSEHMVPTPLRTDTPVSRNQHGTNLVTRTYDHQPHLDQDDNLSDYSVIESESDDVNNRGSPSNDGADYLDDVSMGSSKPRSDDIDLDYGINRNEDYRQKPNQPYPLASKYMSSLSPRIQTPSFSAMYPRGSESSSMVSGHPLLSTRVNDSVDPNAIASLQTSLRDSQRQVEKLANKNTVLESTKHEQDADIAELQQTVDVLSQSQANAEKRKLDMDLEVRSLRFKLENEIESRRSSETSSQLLRDQLERTEEKLTSETETRHSLEVSCRKFEVELRNRNSHINQLESDIGDLKLALEHEKDARSTQEELYNRQLKQHETLLRDAQRTSHEHAQAMSQLEALDSSKKTTESSYNELQLELSRTKGELNLTQSNLNETKNNLQGELNRTKERLQQKSDALAASEKSFVQEEMKCKSIESEMKSLIDRMNLTQENDKNLQKRLQNEIESLKNRLEQSNSTIDKAERLKYDLEKTCQTSREDIHKIRIKADKEIASMRENLQRSELKLEASDRRVYCLESELSSLNAVLSERSGHLNLTQKDIETTKLSLESHAEKLSIEKDKCHQISRDLSNANQTIATLTSERDQLRETLENARISLASKENEIQKSEGASKSVVNSLEDSLNKEKQLFAKTEDNYRVSEKELKDEILKLRNDIKVKDDLLANEKKAVVELEQESWKRKTEVDFLVKEIDTLTSTNVEFKEKLSSIEDKVKLVEDERNSLRLELMNTGSKLEGYTKVSEETTKSLKTKEASLDESRQTLSQLEIELHHLRAEKVNFGNELSESKMRLEAVRSDLKDSNEARKSLESLLANIKSSNVHLEERLQTEAINNVQKDREVEEHRGLWEAEVKSRSKLGLKIVQMEKQISTLKGELIAERACSKQGRDVSRGIDVTIEQYERRSVEHQKEICMLKSKLKEYQRRLKESVTTDSRLPAVYIEHEKERTTMETATSNLRRQIDDLNSKLKNEQDDRRKIEETMKQRQQEHSDTRTKEKILNYERERLFKENRMLEEELARLKQFYENNYIDKSEVEAFRQGVETKARLEINKRLQDLNCQLEEQVNAREALEKVRSKSENTSRQNFEEAIRTVKNEIATLKTSFYNGLSRHEATEFEGRKFKELYQGEIRTSAKLADQLNKAQDHLNEYSTRLDGIERSRNNQYLDSSFGGIDISPIKLQSSLRGNPLAPQIETRSPTTDHIFRSELDRRPFNLSPSYIPETSPKTPLSQLSPGRSYNVFTSTAYR